MNTVGKIFGILVLILALAVGAMSFLLFQQRAAFRAHAELLAQGIMDVATQINEAPGADVQDKLEKISYKKGVSGKDSGSLSFTQYKLSPTAATQALDSLKEAVKIRNEQADALAGTIIKTARAQGIPTSVNEDKLFNAEPEEAKKALHETESFLMNVATRDEAIRDTLRKLGDRVGAAARDSLDKAKFSRFEKAGGSYKVVNAIREIEASYNLVFQQRDTVVAKLDEFTRRIPGYKPQAQWIFKTAQIRGEISRLNSIPKLDANAGRNHIKAVGDRMNALLSDGDGIQGVIGRSQNQIADLKRNVATLQGQIREKDNRNRQLDAQVADLKRQINTLNDDKKKIQENYDWACKNLDALKQAQQINDPTSQLLKKPVIAKLSDIDPNFGCAVKSVNADYQFVILSAGNRELCKNAELVVVDPANANSGNVRLRVVECTDLLSKAYVVKGNPKKIDIGDRVELSIEHEDLIRAGK